jgi:5-methyltetrahydropteroyltriglutamate--homocysteine methyltransferase
MLESSIVGSLPKPTWLAAPNILRAPWRLSGPDLNDAQDDAVRLAILDQEQAGLAIVTDGEVRRRHYIWGFLDGLTGVDTDNLALARSRGGRYAETTEVARIVGQVERKQPVLLKACEFARAVTTRRLKVTMPGPMTIIDSVADEHYRTDRKTLAMKFAAILNAEARELAAAGADVVQFDEPCFNIYLEDVEAWGIEALETSMDGVSATRAVHICYGYGTPTVLAWKTKNTDWGHYGVTFPLTEEIETADVVAARLRRALQHVPAERLFPCTDCGLVPRSREASRGKMRALAEGAAIVRAELTSTSRRALAVP